MREKSAVNALLLGIVFLLLMGSLPLAAQTNPVILPEGLLYGFTPPGTPQLQTVSVYNISGGATITLNSITPSIAQLKVVSGTLPVTLGPGQRADFSIQFTPQAAKSYSGHLTFALAGQPSQAVNVTGNGYATTAVPVLSTTSMTFSNQALGTTSRGQTLTITNQGTTAFSVTGVVVTYPFAQSGWTKSVSVAPGTSLKLTLGYAPTAVASQPGMISLTYDVAPPNGVSLWGNGIEPYRVGSRHISHASDGHAELCLPGNSHRGRRRSAVYVGASFRIDSSRWIVSVECRRDQRIARFHGRRG